MSIKVREGGKYLKLARRLGGVSSFGIYSNSTVLAFLIYYIQSVLYVIQKICVLCITIVLTQNSCYKINCVRFCENSISWITIYVINLYLKIMKLKHVWYYFGHWTHEISFNTICVRYFKRTYILIFDVLTAVIHSDLLVVSFYQ